MIVQIFGPPGSGKSSLLVLFALDALQGHSLSIGHFNYKTNIGDFAPYDRVYSNLEIPGTYKLDVNALGVQNFENCLILMDEVMLDFDCRDFKTLPKHTIRFLATHRHYKCDIVICSQGFTDADKKFRTLTEKLLLVRKVGAFSCVALIDKDTDALNGNIDDVYTKAPPLSRTWFYRPRYFQAFDSFERVPLRPNTAKPWNPPECSSPGLLRCALCGSRFQCCVYVSPVRRAVAVAADLWPFRRPAATTNSGRINYDFVGQDDNTMPEWAFCDCPVPLSILPYRVGRVGRECKDTSLQVL